MVLVAYLFPTKINPPQLIFLLILPHHCIQSVIKFSVNIDHDIKMYVRTYRRLFWEITRLVSKIYCLLPVTSYCSYGLATYRKRLAGCINVSWHMHSLLYFHAYGKLPCTVQQFATLLGFRCSSHTSMIPYGGKLWQWENLVNSP